MRADMFAYEVDDTFKAQVRELTSSPCLCIDVNLDSLGLHTTVERLRQIRDAIDGFLAKPLMAAPLEGAPQ